MTICNAVFSLEEVVNHWTCPQCQTLYPSTIQDCRACDGVGVKTDQQAVDPQTSTSGRKVVFVMFTLIMLLAGTALYGAQTAKKLRVKHPVPAHVQLREIPVELRIDLEELKRLLTGTDMKAPRTRLAQILPALAKAPDKANAIARRAARVLKKIPKMVSAVAAEAQATRNDPFAKKPAKRAAIKRLTGMEGLGDRETVRFAAIRDDALSVHRMATQKLEAVKKQLGEVQRP
jgi:hypothetical protein